MAKPQFSQKELKMKALILLNPLHNSW